MTTGDLSVCMFVCSGSEANDLAWRLAKAHTGNSGGIVMEDVGGPYSNVLKIRPPLVFDENHALQFTDTLDQALQEIV